MIKIEKVAYQIKNDALYNTIYFEVKELLNKPVPCLEEIEALIKRENRFITDYKEINRFSEISSIQVKQLELRDNEPKDCRDIKSEINKNVQRMKELENFEVDSGESAYSIWIGSAGVMVIFALHNIFALFTELYNTHAVMVYSVFAVITALTYWTYRKMKQNHEDQHRRFKDLYTNTESLINLGFERKIFAYDELYI